MPFRIVTWNVNGIRNPFKYLPWNRNRTLQAMFDILEADIVCFQEVKMPKPNMTDDLVFVQGWDTFYSFPHSQTGYSGVAVYTRDSKCVPVRVEEGVTGILKIPGTQTRYLDLPAKDQVGGYPTDKQLRKAAVSREAIDTEGRCLIVEFPLFVLINVYCPARRNLERTGFRNAFLVAVDARVRNLAAAGKNVVLCGDLNIMRDQLDSPGIWGHQGQKLPVEAMEFDETYRSSPSTKLLNQLLFNSRTVSETGTPFVDEKTQQRRPPLLYDTAREKHPARTGMFTCWDTRKNHRPANYGSRIDFVLCSPKLMQLVVDADIQPHLIGSDHCPVYVVFRDTAEDKYEKEQSEGGTSDGAGKGNISDANTGHVTHVLDYLNPLGRFVDGQPALSPEQDAALVKRFPQSARQMPQFANRQHIGNMFRRSVIPPVSQGDAAPVAAANNVDSKARGTAAACQELPDALRADSAAYIESSDDDDGAVDDIVENDLPSRLLAADDESESVEPTNPRGTKPVASLRNAAAVSETPSDVSRSTSRTRAASVNTPRGMNNGAQPAVSVGSEFTDLFAEEGDTISEDDNACSSETACSVGGGRHSTALPKPRAATRRPLARSQSTGKPGFLSSSSRPAKRTKTGTTTTAATPSATSGFQTSISMFLQARAGSQDVKYQQEPPEGQSARDDDGGGNNNDKEHAPQPSHADNSFDGADDGVLSSSSNVSADADDNDPNCTSTATASKATWSRLGLGQHQAPRCEHGEPCKTFVTKKAGVNSGRSFYMCARPPGPLGRKEKGTPWQCTTFVWCRDWKPERPA
ncbi:DNA lyase [Niveomyces insectorum RCEF 264]|uniref:DNA-(apurinic or apyrimidinic site) endonuclease 2 n=1 Tax=Niveomyces insectorum RCEF 264 TaxID=1081102 RepID=A0A167W3M9_9HYPO|nr:DNA lyase [Niveomyces insectorum RCEF 264]